MSMLIDPVVSMQFSRRPRVQRVCAGYGSYGGDAGEARYRCAEPPDARFYAVGFRICLSRSCNVNAD